MKLNQSLFFKKVFKSLNVFFVIVFLLASKLTLAQTTFPVNGPFDERPEVFALTNAVITIAPGQVIENGTIVVKKGIIESVGQNVRIPENAVVYDIQGAHIYPSFIDLYTSYGIKEVSGERRSRRDGPQFLSDKKGAYGWNEAIKPEIRAHQIFHRDNDKAESFRNQGFGAVLSHQEDGIARGTGVFVSLANKPDNEVILEDMASAHYSFDKGSSTQDYPGSLMGAIALIRQTYLDAEWYKNGGNEKEYNISLDNWNKIQRLPQFFEITDWLSLLRAQRIADEFNKNYIYVGSGDEYQRLEAIKNTGRPLVIPLKFPDAFDVSDPFDALNVSLADMMHWEMAPSNAAYLEKHNIDFAISSHGLENINQFRKSLEKAIKHGLSKEAAMKALTTKPAEILGLEDKIGTLEKGKIANFLVTSGDIFDASTSIYQNWIQGVSHKVTDYDFIDIRGTYELTLNDMRTFNLIIGGQAHKIDVKLQQDTIEKKIHFERKHFLISMMFEDPSATVEG
ncbi:MAG: amidohydrolase, partial [Chitinophagaceae bacterium]